MLVSRELKKNPITWKVVEGEVKDDKALAKYCKVIEYHPSGPTTLPPALTVPACAGTDAFTPDKHVEGRR